MRRNNNIYRLLGFQSIVVLVLASFFGFLLGQQALWSAVIGGVVGVFANGLFAMLLFCTRKSYIKPNKVLFKFYVAEVMKFAFTIIIFAALIRYTNLSILPLLVTYFVGYMSFSFMGLFFS